jgi:hypothetical protein
MGWLSGHQKKFEEEQKAKSEAEAEEKARAEGRSARADAEAKSLYEKVREVHGRKTKRGKIAVSLKENRVDVTVGGKSFAYAYFVMTERMEGEADGQGWGTGEYYMHSASWYDDDYGIYRNGYREYFNEEELARKLAELLSE